jgi:hypothetical protein
MSARRLLVFGTAILAVAAIGPQISQATLKIAEAPVQMVITALPAHGNGPVERLTPGDISVLQGDTRGEVLSLQPLTGVMAAEQLVVLLDDSSQSASLSVHFNELRPFLEKLPATTEVAVGYMRNGTVLYVQPFTKDHDAAANSLRLPLGVPGVNGSPYFSLSDLLGHWPSKNPAQRRDVLMLTDGVDRYFGTSIIDDPYVDAAIRDAAKQKVAVYPIYLFGAGGYGRGLYTRTFAQSRLLLLAQQTGGYAYFEDFTNPVTIAPFLSDFDHRMANQYLISVAGLHGKGLQTVKVVSERPDVKITAAERVYLP